MKRRAITMLTTTAVLIAMACGVALASSIINCPNQPGTASSSGTGQADTVNGSDVYDLMFGGKGDDRISASQRMSPVAVGISREIIDCGPGTDTVHFDKGLDSVKNCEVKYPY